MDDTEDLQEKPSENRARFAIRLLITLSLLAYLGSKVSWTTLAGRVSDADLRWLAMACLLFGTTYFLGAIRWWLLMRVLMIRMPLRLVIALSFVGQFFNSLLPGSTGGDLVRAFYAVQYSPQRRTHALLSIIVDRVMVFFVVLCCALAGLWLQFAPIRASGELAVIRQALLWLFLFGLAVVAAVLAVPFARLPSALQRAWSSVPRRHNIELLVSGLRRYARTPLPTLGALSCSLAIQLLVFWGGYGIARSIGLDATFGQIVVALAVVTCIVSVPVSIGGHGVREGAFVLLFAGLGVLPQGSAASGPDLAILFSLLYFLLLAVWSLVGGLVYLSLRGQRPARAEAGVKERGG